MNDLFDNLARALAHPMPRRRALGLAAGAVIAVVLPGGRATAAPAVGSRAWRTAGCGKNGGGISCAKQFGPQVSECCGPIDKTNPNSNYTCCPPGECWHQGTGKNSNTTCCPPAYRCRSRCCARGERCVDGECSRCESDKLCGTECCEQSEDCANPARSLCCPKTWHKCTAGLAGVAKCCPPNDQCCFNKATKSAVCCDKQHPCVDGRCKCLKNEKPCGGKCCRPGLECSNGKCCPKGKVNCGGSCCDADDCCGKVCCDGPSRLCVKGKCCEGERLLGSGASAQCCPPNTVAGSGPNRNTCCPDGDPDCCRDGDVKLTCGAGKTCVNGTCLGL